MRCFLLILVRKKREREEEKSKTWKKVLERTKKKILFILTSALSFPHRPLRSDPISGMSISSHLISSPFLVAPSSFFCVHKASISSHLLGAVSGGNVSPFFPLFYSILCVYIFSLYVWYIIIFGSKSKKNEPF